MVMILLISIYTFPLAMTKKKKKKNHEEGAASQLVALVTRFPNIEKE